MGKFKIFTGIIVSVFLIYSFVRGIPKSEENLPQVRLRNTEVRTINSMFVEGMEYKIYIALPEDNKESSEKYPIFYFTDAWFLFGAFTQIYRELEWSQEIPRLILVGISWEGNSDDAFFYRSRDFTPTIAPQGETSFRRSAMDTCLGWGAEFHPLYGRRTIRHDRI